MLTLFHGQEEENAKFLVDSNCAIWIKKDTNVFKVFKDLYRNQENLETMRKNSKTISKPNSTSNICKILLEKNEKADDLI